MPTRTKRPRPWSCSPASASSRWWWCNVLDAHKIAAHPTLDGLDDAYLSGWSCSAHERSQQGNFQPLVMIKDAAPEPYDPVYQAPDGTVGHVYVLATGATLACDEADETRR